MDVEALNVIVKSIFTILTVLIASFVVPYLKEKIGQEKYNRLLSYAENAVRFAEQMFKAGENEKKKQDVYNYVMLKSKQLGLDLEPADIDIIVEGVVNAVKHGN